MELMRSAGHACEESLLRNYFTASLVFTSKFQQQKRGLCYFKDNIYSEVYPLAVTRTMEPPGEYALGASKQPVEC